MGNPRDILLARTNTHPPTPPPHIHSHHPPHLLDFAPHHPLDLSATTAVSEQTPPLFGHLDAEGRAPAAPEHRDLDPLERLRVIHLLQRSHADQDWVAEHRQRVQRVLGLLQIASGDRANEIGGISAYMPPPTLLELMQRHAATQTPAFDVSTADVPAPEQGQAEQEQQGSR